MNHFYIRSNAAACESGCVLFVAGTEYQRIAYRQRHGIQSTNNKTHIALLKK